MTAARSRPRPFRVERDLSFVVGGNPDDLEVLPAGSHVQAVPAYYTALLRCPGAGALGEYVRRSMKSNGTRSTYAGHLAFVWRERVRFVRVDLLTAL